MPKRDFLIVVREHPDSEENCYSQHHVAYSMDDAITWFAKQRDIKGGNLNRFLDNNGRKKNCKKKMVYALPYHRDEKKMKRVYEVRRETAALGNKLPGYLDEYRQPEPPANYPEMEPVAEQQPRRNFPVKNIPIPTKNTERDLPDWEKRVLYYAKLEHRGEDDEDYNK